MRASSRSAEGGAKVEGANKQGYRCRVSSKAFWAPKRLPRTYLVYLVDLRRNERRREFRRRQWTGQGKIGEKKTGQYIQLTAASPAGLADDAHESAATRRTCNWPCEA